jgi:hypothetical protein
MSESESTTDSQRQPRPPLGSRDDHWGATEDANGDRQDGVDAGAYGVGDGPGNNPGPAGVWKPPANDPNEVIAHQLLRAFATIICKRTVDEEGRMVELTDPCIRPPTDTVRDARFRKRFNPETGYISGGESTSVTWAPMATDDLLELVDLYLEGRHGDLLDHQKESARELAYRQKKQGDLSDYRIMSNVVEHVRTASPTED